MILTPTHKIYILIGDFASNTCSSRITYVESPHTKIHKNISTYELTLIIKTHLWLDALSNMYYLCYRLFHECAHLEYLGGAKIKVLLSIWSLKILFVLLIVYGI